MEEYITINSKESQNIDLKASLRKYFGFDTFKGEQKIIIDNVLSGRNSFVIMPTGGGKSMCYQLPALLLQGTAIIVSPLIALMKNQVDAIRNVSDEESIAHFMNSSLSKSELQQVRNDITAGKTKMLYVAPESLTKKENIPSLVTPAEQLAEDFVPGRDLNVVVKCDVWPEIQWKTIDGRSRPYMGLSGSYKRKPFNQARFESALNDLAERYAKLEPFEDETRALKMGDACKVNMVGYMATPSGEKGEPLPDAASGDDVEVILGGGRYMAGLVEGLEGGKVGETKIVKVRFPDALKNKDLAGKNAIFDVTILSANKRILPEINDDFANTVRPGLTAEALRDELIKAVDAQDAELYMGARNAALGKALAETLDVDIPDTLITNSAREKYALMMTDMRDSGMDDEEIKKLISPENFLKYKEIERPDIVRDFKVSMAVDEIARLENVQVPAYQVEEQLQSLKDQATKEGTAASDMDDDQLRRKVESTLERRMVYDLLAEAANLEVEYINEGGFDEALMERLATESAERERKAAEEGKQIDDVVIDATAATATAVQTTTIATTTIVDKKNEVVASSVVGTAASSKEEDINLTTQVILNYINADSNDDGVVDDEDEDDDDP